MRATEKAFKKLHQNLCDDRNSSVPFDSHTDGCEVDVEMDMIGKRLVDNADQLG